MSVIIFQEEVFVSAVCRKCHRRNAQAWEAALEAVESCEGSGVSPRLTVHLSQFHAANDQSIYKSYTHARAHGSFAGVPAAAANAFGSKPVRFARGALRTLPQQLLASASKLQHRTYPNSLILDRLTW